MGDQLVDETEVEGVAARLRRASETVALGGTTIEQRVAEAKWAGPMRERYHQTAIDQKQKLHRDSRQLIEIATKLERHAQWIRDEKARLDGLKARIESWAAANPVGSSKTGCDASLIRERPPRHNYGWERVAERLRANGAAF
jgi:uncharacterized protein YukE